MKEVTFSEFKAKCLPMLEEVLRTKEPIRVTKFGKPIAEVVPSSANQEQGTWIGSMKGEIKFLGDVLSPVFEVRDWKESEE
jgi:prevent-host-death family protein